MPRRRLALEALESRQLLAAIVMTPDEQLVIEMINRARANPNAEAARLEMGLNDGLAPGTISSTPKPPLAPHQALVNAAQAHSQDMIDRDFFDHINPSGQNPGHRITAAGYNWNAYGENIAQTYSAVDVHNLLFESPSHRTNIMSTNYREIGVGVRIADDFFSSVYGTEKFANRSGNSFITGVAFSDHVINDNFYSVGEQLGGVTISAQRTTGGAPLVTTTGPSGGYSLQAAAGTYVVTASGGPLAAPMQQTITIGSQNVKVDFIVAPPPIEPDSFEPNDSAAQATVLNTDSFGSALACGLSIHESFNDDYFRYVAPASGNLTVSLDLRQDAGDVDLFVLRQNLSVLDSSESLEDIESVTVPVTSGAVYYIQVLGYEGARHAHYDLVIDGPLPNPARIDAYEPNNDWDSAHVLSPGPHTLSGLVNDGFRDLDFFRWTPDQSGAVRVSLAGEGNGGEWNLGILDANQDGLAETTTAGGAAELVVQVTAGTSYYFATLGSPCQTLYQPYTLSVTPIAPPQAASDRVMVITGGSGTFQPLANDQRETPAWGQTAVQLVELPEHGSATVNAQTGEITYTPQAGFVGLDRLTYTATDSVGNTSVPALVDLVVVDPDNRPWQNPLNPYDVDGDGTLTPTDALLIITQLNAGGTGTLAVPTPLNFPTPYFDVSGDNTLGALDAIEVINRLNAGGSAQSGANGEAAAAAPDNATEDQAKTSTPTQAPYDDAWLIAVARELAAQAERGAEQDAAFAQLEREDSDAFELFA